MKTKSFLVVISALAAVVIGGLTLAPKNEQPAPHATSSGTPHKLVVYKSATCGCCGLWANYMKGRGYAVETVDTEELDAVKAEHGIPGELNSCHTTIIDDGKYFVEGHIPEEAVAKLISEEPDIAGIGMPGMPAASPGMGGSKAGPFNISQVDNDGNVTQYMSI